MTHPNSNIAPLPLVAADSPDRFTFEVTGVWGGRPDGKRGAVRIVDRHRVTVSAPGIAGPITTRFRSVLVYEGAGTVEELNEMGRQTVAEFVARGPEPRRVLVERRQVVEVAVLAWDHAEAELLGAELAAEEGASVAGRWETVGYSPLHADPRQRNGWDDALAEARAVAESGRAS